MQATVSTRGEETMHTIYGGKTVKAVKVALIYVAELVSTSAFLREKERVTS